MPASPGHMLAGEQQAKIPMQIPPSKQRPLTSSASHQSGRKFTQSTANDTPPCASCICRTRTARTGSHPRVPAPTQSRHRKAQKSNAWEASTGEWGSTRQPHFMQASSLHPRGRAAQVMTCVPGLPSPSHNRTEETWRGKRAEQKEENACSVKQRPM